MLIFAYGTENADKIRLYLLTEKKCLQNLLIFAYRNICLQNLLTKTC